MALTAQDQQLLKDIYQRLKDIPLTPGNAFYEPVYQQAGVEDPMAKLGMRIELSGAESLQLFSGFQGSGKTTELFRLRRDLEQKGCLVLYANALDYISDSNEVDITTMLMSIAGAFGEHLKDEGAHIMSESFWARFSNYLTNTTIELSDVGIKTEAGVPAIAKELVGDIKAGVDLKLALKTAPSFRQKLESFLANRLYELKQQVNTFVEEGVKRIREKKGRPELPIVFLFDQFEQVRGSRTNEQEVIHSIEKLFRDHLQMLRLPLVHVIYTVPPWLQFSQPGAFNTETNIETLPCVRLWKNDPQRSHCPEGWRLFRETIIRRFDKNNFNRIFGADQPAAQRLVDPIIVMSGGHFRDLLHLLRETLVLILTWQPELPVKPEVIERAIANLRSQFLPIAIEDARWLDRIARERNTGLIDNKPESVSRLNGFLNRHWALYLTNGKDWYDIHPLIRDEVATLAKSPTIQQT